MKPGFFTMPLHPPGANMTETLKSDLDQIVKLDELGYAEAWIGEHFTAAWENIPSPELFIAQALGVTKNIRLGTGVTCMPNHDPFVLAHRIAQLDHMSEGRLNWGIGTGSFPGDTQVFGYDEDGGVDAGAYTRESLQTILKIWDNPEPGLYESKWWKFRIPERRDDIGLGAHVTPFQKPHPPIGVAGVSPNSPTLRMAGQFGWIPMSINLAPPVQIKTHWDSIEEGALEAGTQPDRSLWRVAREVFIADTTSEARRMMQEGTLARDFERYFLPMLAHDGRLGIFKIDPDMPDSDVTIDYLMDNVFIVGSADEVTQKLNDLNDELGGFGTLLAMGHEWDPYDAWYESMSVLVKEVLPKVD
ncbi:MAG: LLM class flavin-dependent oxidoreductase [Chloroflexota bacterium]|nr:LLM class flavin-dependent oxidoreductase [Chloroflexota bacterium]